MAIVLPLILTGLFGTSNAPAPLYGSVVQAVSGPFAATCTYNHHSGFEGYALNFSCIGPDGLVRGRLGIEVDASDHVTWNGGATVNYFEGPDTFTDFNFDCHGLSSTQQTCTQTTTARHDFPYRNQFPFKIKLDDASNFSLIMDLAEPAMPCSVAIIPGATGLKVKCYSNVGVFVGQTTAGARNPWSLTGEFSTFYGPGNYIRMTTVCTAQTPSETSGGVITDCPAMPVPPVNPENGDGDAIQWESQTDGTSSGPASIQRGMGVHVDPTGLSTLDGHAVLALQYNGSLSGKIRAYVEVIGLTGRHSQTVTLSRGDIHDPNSPTIWLNDRLNPELMAGTASGTELTAWEVAVAFVDEHGRWDSDGGRNFRFHFNAQPLTP